LLKLEQLKEMDIIKIKARARNVSNFLLCLNFSLIIWFCMQT